MKEIFERVSIRKFLDKKVEPEKIELLLRAGMAAPSAKNGQPWEFIVVENKETLEKLSLATPYTKLIKDSPLAIVVLANLEHTTMPEYYEHDLGAASENILLEAVSLDLGGVWTGIAPFENQMNYVKELFDLPEHIKVYAILAIGYPVNKHLQQDRFKPEKIHYEKY